MPINMSFLKQPSMPVWVFDKEFPSLENCYINGQMVAWLEPRPSYCDRGHWKTECELPDIDGQDGFPRYYMEKDTAKREMELFLQWRLWQKRKTP